MTSLPSDFIESCETCGGPLRAGVCPRCLMRAAFEPEPVAAAGDAPVKLGDYELLKVIERGGMGVVWRARQTRLNREVALKILRETCLPGEEPARRFRIEAEAAALLRHPHIVTVYEVGECEGRYFLSMELLAGSLAERLARGPLPPREAVELLAKVARAIQHAHDRGVLHRDLKPSNILLDEHGEPRVSDFGLARLGGDGDHPTMTGALLGTPAYMAPEQATGAHGEVTTQSDIYSLGAVFFEMLTGRVPFSAPSHLDLLRQVAEAAPPRPSSLVRTIDRDLEVICLKCLEKAPAARYASARALSEDLERWRRGEPIHARPAPLPERAWKWARRHKSRAALLAMAAGSLVIVAALTFGFTKRLQREVELKTAAEREALHRLAGQHGEAAAQLIRRGDWLRALPHLAENCALLEDDAAAAAMARRRFETIIRSAPRLAHLWLPEGTLRGVDFDPTFHRVAIFAGDTVTVFDSRTGAPAGPPLRHPGEISHGYLLERSNLVLTETQDTHWHLWDRQSGRELASGPGNIFPVRSAPTVHDRGLGERFLTWHEKSVQMHASATGADEGAPMVFEHEVEWALATRIREPNGDPANGPECHLVATVDGWLHFIDPVTRSAMGPPVEVGKNASLRAFDWESQCYALESDAERGLRYLLIDLPGRKIAASAINPASTHRVHGWLGRPRRWCILDREDNGFTVRDAAKGSPLMLALHAAQGYSAATGSTTLFASSRDGALRLWSDGGDPLTPFLWVGGRPEYLLQRYDAELLLCASTEPAVRLWEPKPDDALLVGSKPTRLPGAVAASDALLLADAEGNVERWNLNERQAVNPPTSCGHDIEVFVAAPGDRFALLIGAQKGQVWNVSEHRRVGAIFSCPADIRSAVLSADGGRLALLSRSGKCQSGAAGNLVPVTVAPEMRQLAMSSDGSHLLAVGTKQSELWQLSENGATLITKLARAAGGAFCADGSRFVLWGGGPQPGASEAHVHETATGREILPSLAHLGEVTSASFSPDGRLLLTGSRYDARLWNLADGQLLLALRDHPLPAQACGFSPDGELMWTRTNKELYLWETATGTLVAPPMRVQGKEGAMFSPDGRWLIAADDKHGFRAWDVSPSDRSVKEMRALARRLSSHRLTNEGALYPLTAAELREVQNVGTAPAP